MKLITDVSQLVISGHYWATLAGYNHGLQLVQMLSDNVLPEKRYFMYKNNKIKCPIGYNTLLGQFDFYGPVVAPGYEKIQEMRKASVTDVPDNLVAMPASRTEFVNRSIMRTLSESDPNAHVLQQGSFVRSTFYKFLDTSGQHLRPDGAE